jgi:hypothetical protein
MGEREASTFMRHRATPEPGVGSNVDPLGEVLMKLLPDGFRVLFAPAAAPPALRFGLLPDEVPIPVPVVVPPTDDPVVVPLVADPPAAVPPAAEPVPLCAKAKVLVRAKIRAKVGAKAVASPMRVSFIMIFPLQ